VTEPLRVDAHQHFWDPSRADYPWLAGAPATLARPFGPDDLRPLLAANGIGRTIVVQARASIDETRQLLSVAATESFVAGVVGWVDRANPAVGEVIRALRAGAGGERLVGIRHQVHDEPDPDWLLRPDVLRGLRAVATEGLVYELLVRPRELPAALQVVRQLPDLRFVVDHLAKPPIRHHRLEPWASLLRPFAGLGNAWAKVSGLVTEADWDTWAVDDIQPFVREAIAVFTPERLMFGSDWPVCLLAAPYDRVVALTESLTAGFTVAERYRLFGGTAREVYRLDGDESEVLPRADDHRTRRPRRAIPDVAQPRRLGRDEPRPGLLGRVRHPPNGRP
jgi:L-fuconolactonase